jgi:hypothetical protein
MIFLENQLLIPFDIRDNDGYYYDYNSYDWDLLIKKSNEAPYIFGSYCDDKDIWMANVSHFVKNIRETNYGIYGDVCILETTKGLELQKLIDSGIEVVFRPRIEADVDIQTMYIKAFNIDTFYCVFKTNDRYGNIIYRKDKLHKIKNNIIKNEN